MVLRNLADNSDKDVPIFFKVKMEVSVNTPFLAIHCIICCHWTFVVYQQVSPEVVAWPRWFLASWLFKAAIQHPGSLSPVSLLMHSSVGGIWMGKRSRVDEGRWVCWNMAWRKPSSLVTPLGADQSEEPSSTQEADQGGALDPLQLWQGLHQWNLEKTADQDIGTPGCMPEWDIRGVSYAGGCCT